MKRHTTELEEKLINRGFKLESKSYCGNHSQKVEFYVYTLEENNYKFYFYLDNKRLKVHHFYFESINLPRLIGGERMEELEQTYYGVKEFIENLWK